MLSFFKLIRFPNLLIIAITQYAMRWGIIYPIVKSVDSALCTAFPERFTPGTITLQLSEFHFFLVVLSTMLIAAAGYIINDYFDVKLDRINKPDEVVVDTKINRRFAILWHSILNISAITIAFWLGFKAGMWKISIIYFVCAGGLWYYSTTFKRQLLTGNILISLFTALVPIVVIVFDVPLLIKNYSELIDEFNINFNRINYFVLGFSFFAFMTTLIREIIKDMEDIEGDKEYGCNTLPISIGIGKTKIIVIMLILLTIAAIGYIQFTQLPYKAYPSIFYLLFAVQIPLILLAIMVIRAKEPKQFTLPSKINKVIMLLGILYTLIIYNSFT